MPSLIVADGDLLLRRALATLFGDEGFAVRTAADGRGALIRHRREPADLIVADVELPRVDGCGLVDALRSRGDQTPVVLMSVDQPPPVALPNVGAVVKPFDLEDLLAAASAALRLARSSTA